MAITNNEPVANIKEELSSALQLHQTEQLDEALKKYIQLEKIAQHDANLKYLIGVVYYQQSQFSKAIEYIQQAIHINPNEASYYHNLGNALTGDDNLAEAVFAYEEAISITNGEYEEAIYNLGAVLHKLGKWQKEIEYYYLGLTKNPKNNILLFEKIKAMQLSCYWPNLDKYESHIIEVTKNEIKEDILPALTPYHSLTLNIDPILKKKIAQNYANLKYNNMKQIGELDHMVKEVLNIAYIYPATLEAKIKDQLTLLLDNHNTDKFNTKAYKYGIKNSEASSIAKDLTGKRPEEIAQNIYDDKIDILIDLAGYSENSLSSILAMRPAPVQISFLTYPGTMGADFIDYLITDKVAVTNKDDYTEELLFLDNSYYLTDKVTTTNTPSKEEFNLPTDKFIFCCFNKSSKIDQKTFHCWMQILKQTKNSVLWLIEDNEFIQNNLKKTATDNDVDSSRLIFSNYINKQNHINRYQLADLYLDSFNVNARSAAAESLSCNLPIITKAGNDIISRTCASILSSANLPHLIANTDDEYINLACKYASNKSDLDKLSQNIQSKALFNIKNYVKNIEKLFIKTHKKLTKDIN